MLKLLVTAMALALSMPAFAYTECAGETYAGTIVKVAVTTVGAMGVPQKGEVHIALKDGTTRGYTIQKAEIAQFFETENAAQAFVGLAAYQASNNPLWIRYVGTNHQEDLVKVLRTPGRQKELGNEMRVWKGPGYAANEQYQFTDVVCTVALDP